MALQYPHHQNIHKHCDIGAYVFIQQRTTDNLISHALCRSKNLAINELSVIGGGTSNFNLFPYGANCCDFIDKQLVEAISPSCVIHHYLMPDVLKEIMYMVLRL